MGSVNIIPATSPAASAVCIAPLLITFTFLSGEIGTDPDASWRGAECDGASSSGLNVP